MYRYRTWVCMTNCNSTAFLHEENTIFFTFCLTCMLCLKVERQWPEWVSCCQWNYRLLYSFIAPSEPLWQLHLPYAGSISLSTGTEQPPPSITSCMQTHTIQYPVSVWVTDISNNSLRLCRLFSNTSLHLIMAALSGRPNTSHRLT